MSCQRCSKNSNKRVTFADGPTAPSMTSGRPRCSACAVCARLRHQAHAAQVIFYAKDSNLQMLSKVAQYVIKNESGLWLVVVHFFEDETSPMLQELANNISVLVKCVLPRHILPYFISLSGIEPFLTPPWQVLSQAEDRFAARERQIQSREC